jgi:hypothetical protein
MPTKKSHLGIETNIKVANISGVSGNVSVAGGNITIHHTSTGLSVEEISQVFLDIYRDIDGLHGMTPATKDDLKAEVKEIQSTVTEAAQKNEKLDEGFLSRRFRNIARLAPDILDVIVATLANPLAGMGVAVKKIAEKAKEEIE